MQNPFHRTHSVDSALPNPDLLDTPPQMSLLSTSANMPSLLETGDSQDAGLLCQVWLGNLLPDASRQDVVAVLELAGQGSDASLVGGCALWAGRDRSAGEMTGVRSGSSGSG